MTDLGEPSIETPSPRMLFEVGYEHLADSMRRDTTDSPRERAEMAHIAGLYFAAGQNSALLAIAERLAELVEQQKLGNVIAAYQCRARDDFLTVDEQEDAAVYVNSRINEIVYRRSGDETA